MQSLLPNADPHQARLAAATECISKQQFLPAQLLLQDVWQAKRASASQRLAAAQQLVTLLASSGRIEAARATIREALNLISVEGEQASALTPFFSFQTWRLSTFWWNPIKGRSVTLRRATRMDADWIKTAFADSTFAQSVNKVYAKKVQALPLNQLANHLEKEMARPCIDRGSLMMLIETNAGDVVGLACLVAMDVESKRAELIIGFTDSETPATLIAESFILFLHMAFQQAGFHKLTALLYEDNPRYQMLVREMTNLGFETEGTHRDHFRLPNGRYIDMKCLALIDRDFFANPSAQRLIRRYTMAET